MAEQLNSHNLKKIEFLEKKFKKGSNQGSLLKMNSNSLLSPVQRKRMNTEDKMGQS
jgi:hypothetical protein